MRYPLIGGGVDLPEKAHERQQLIRIQVAPDLPGAPAVIEQAVDRLEDQGVVAVMELATRGGSENVRQGVLLAAERGEMVEPAAQ